jgi:tetratricopeptide (TPR) repeat protein
MTKKISLYNCSVFVKYLLPAFFIIFFVVSSITAQTDDKQTLKQLNQNLITAYKSQKIDEALKMAYQAVELSLKVYGADNEETAVAFSNLGAILKDKRKFVEAVQNYQKALVFYEKNAATKAKDISAVHLSLANIFYLDDKKKAAESHYLKAIQTVETNFGKESKELLVPKISTGRFYAFIGNFEKADEFFLDGYRIVVKNYGNDSEEIEKIDDIRTCATLPSTYRKSPESFKVFQEQRDLILGKTSRVGAEVVNGKAKTLAKPPYPDEAKAQRAGGAVAIKVKIDEVGNVVETKILCGHPILATVSELAAKKSIFTPTMLDGKAVKVTGIVVYNFVAQ